MAYTKQNFKNGDTLTATHLNMMENGIIAASKDFNFWADKTMVCVGDSITAGSGTTQTYWAMLKEILGLSKMTGMGVGGSCVSAKSDYGTGNSPLINRYKNIPEADLITIFMGTNDWGHETPLGTIEDTTDVSFYGALNVIIPNLMTMHPNSRIIWITPMHRYGFGTSKILGTKFTYDHIANGRGHTLKDYVDAIKDVCERYSIPIIDLYSISGLHPSIAAHKSTYMPDGLHPNKAGHEKMAYLISKWLQIYANVPIVSTDPVAGVELDITSSPLQVGSTITINSSVLPITANNKKVIWSIKSGSSYASITS
jgi:lysophospholipase L1-like esterase